MKEATGVPTGDGSVLLPRGSTCGEPRGGGVLLPRSSTCGEPRGSTCPVGAMKEPTGVASTGVPGIVPLKYWDADRATVGGGWTTATDGDGERSGDGGRTMDDDCERSWALAGD